MKVTITGADDGVDPFELFRLSVRFPFVEWGILYSQKRMGEPRYPSATWLSDLLKLLRRADMPCSLHVCGSASRRAIADGEVGQLPGSSQGLFRRIQLNGYEAGAREKLPSIVEATAAEVILQARDRAELVSCSNDARVLNAGAGGFSVLYDPSSGRGIPTVGWPEPQPEVKTGYAGGIGPGNVKEHACAVWQMGAAWIDMESGVRDDSDRFDLLSAKYVLEIVADLRIGS